MNERIQQLADEAKKYALDAMIKIADKEQALKVYSETYDTKFAELIVAECIDIVKPTQHHEVWAQSYLGGVDGLDLLYSKIKDIKKHFGVEQ